MAAMLGFGGLRIDSAVLAPFCLTIVMGGVVHVIGVSLLALPRQALFVPIPRPRFGVSAVISRTSVHIILLCTIRPRFPHYFCC